MKHSFQKKHLAIAFFSVVVLMSATTILLHSCNKKEDEKEKPKPKILEKKVVTTPEKKMISDKRVIYLTFDDGPNNGTENLLKVLHKNEIKATAFIVGKHVSGSQKQKNNFESLQKDTLIELANHSFSHANNKYVEFYKDPSNVVKDFERADDSLHFLTKIARTPGRNIWRTHNISATDIKTSKNAADELQKFGYKVVGWDLEWKNDKKMGLEGNHQKMLKKVDSIFFNDLEKTPRHLVFLTHDQYLQDENSVNELDLFIQKLKESDRFEFKKISEYPKINEILN